MLFGLLLSSASLALFVAQRVDFCKIHTTQPSLPAGSGQFGQSHRPQLGVGGMGDGEKPESARGEARVCLPFFLALASISGSSCDSSRVPASPSQPHVGGACSCQATCSLCPSSPGAAGYFLLLLLSGFTICSLPCELLQQLHDQYSALNPLHLTASFGFFSPDQTLTHSLPATTKTYKKRKSTFKKNKIMASSPIASWQIDGETTETVTDRLDFLGLQNHCRW